MEKVIINDFMANTFVKFKINDLPVVLQLAKHRQPHEKNMYSLFFYMEYNPNGLLKVCLCSNVKTLDTVNKYACLFGYVFSENEKSNEYDFDCKLYIQDKCKVDWQCNTCKHNPYNKNRR